MKHGHDNLINTINELSEPGFVETMRWENQQLFLENRHFQRLFSALNHFAIPIPAYFTTAYLKQAILECINLSGNPTVATLRLLVYVSAPAGTLDYRIECLPFRSWPPEGIDCHLFLQNFKDPRDPYAACKTTERKLFRLALDTALEKGFQDALICNLSGRVVESTMANLFIGKNGRLFTPPISEGCIGGIFRASLLELLKGKIDLREIPISVPMLLEAEEVFLCNSVRGLINVRRIENHSYTSQRLFRKLSAWLKAL